MSKKVVVISSPVDTYSGYGARSRDVIKALINLKKDVWDIKLLSQRWGSTPFGYLEDHSEHDLKSRVIEGMESQPDGWIQITVPNEFQKVGKNFSIGVTAGIETNLCDVSWIQGINNMDLTLVSSNFSKEALVNSAYQEMDKATNALIKTVKAEKPIEVLFEGVDVEKYFKETSLAKYESDLVSDLDKIQEEFCYLYVGHWLQGTFGEDRKNTGMLVKLFMEAFKGKQNKPALILKTSHAKTSTMDRYAIMKKIDEIAESVGSKNIPNVYVLHGDLDDEDINLLYNHRKVKAMVSFTKGEGYGRPLAEFAMTGKPLIVSNYSGYLDFLKPAYNYFVSGQLTPVHETAQVPNLILKDSAWFSINPQEGFNALRAVHDKYKDYLKASSGQPSYIQNNFSFDKMQSKLSEYLEEYSTIPEFKEIVLPQLKKL